MQSVAPLPLFINVFTQALTVAFMLIVFWYDVKRLVMRVFALFLAMVMLWNLGFMFQELLLSFNIIDSWLIVADVARQIGFAAAPVGLCALLVVLVGVQPRRFWTLLLLYLLAVLVYAVVLFTSINSADGGPATLQTFDQITAPIFNIVSLYILWRYRRKLRSTWLLVGALTFIIGQGLRFLNPQLTIVSLSTTVSSIGALIVSIAIVQREIIAPLLERGNQLVSMHNVSIAITSRLATDAVLTEIAERAAKWLEADASGIFLRRGQYLELVAQYNLPSVLLGHTTPIGQGMVGEAAAINEPVHIENYSRDWKGEPDLPLAMETFGSTIAVPLVFNQAVIGTLLVTAGVHSRLLDQANVDSLELLAAQAAVAISHGTLFSNQKRLTQELASTNAQLTTVLEGTESPVIAVNRRLELIFANPAARALIDLEDYNDQQPITDLVPAHVLPTDYRAVIAGIKQHQVYSYEVSLAEKTYFCHLASLGQHRIEGWVAVLNDVTELKELDRVKSEMVRMTSHDLKNPLQAAMANLELLRDDLHDVNDQEVTLSVDNIDKQLQKMMRIISGILDLERVRLGFKPTERCDPVEIVAAVVEELEDIANDNRVQLETAIDPNLPLFLGDREQFSRALVNLVENAIKFNLPDGYVRLTAQQQDKQIKFAIEDDGIGIPQDVQARIFERFYRGHQPGAEHISGSGLGLSLVKAVIESHHGSIWVESEPKQGTTFHILVPAIVSDAAKNPQP